MSYFILIFSTRGSKSPTLARYVDAREATDRLLETEARLRDDPDHDVVLLYAGDEESLRKTHGSYFLGFDELLEMAQG